MASWRIPPQVRSAAAGVLGLAGAAFFAHWMDRRQKMGGWFFFDLATLWLWTLVLSAACLSVGQLVVRKLLPARDRTWLETVALAFPAGLVVFVMGMYLGGFLALYGRVFAVGLPALMLAVGAPSAVRAWRDAAATRGSATMRLSGVPLVVSLFGLLLLGILYLGAMSPEAINYDASWVHMVIPQDYAREGRIVAFPGDQVKNVPHLGGMVVTWGFLVPGLDLPALRWMMALHIEVSMFVWTVVGVAAATRWLAEREVRGAWAAFALYPGIFVYDSNLGGASDHFLALFGVPLFLSTAKLLTRFDRRAAILVGVMAGGGLLSKFQVLYLLVPLLVWALGRGGLAAVRRRNGDAEAPSPAAVLKAIGLAAAVAFVLMLPHLLSNVVFYRNPLYPLAQDIFRHSRPTIRDAALQVRNVLADWNSQPPGGLGQRFVKGLEMAFTFSFIPHYSFVNYLPVFGSTFTLALPLLLVLPRARRLWVGALIVFGALVLWAMSYWVDRNLQTFMPMLAAVTGALLVRAWELGWLARIGVAALVLVQVAWATPLYFSGSDRINGAISLIRGGLEGRSREQLQGYRSHYVALGKSLPKDAVVMLHNQHIMLGIDRPVILDWVGFQTIIDYRLYKTPRELDARLREIGVTHVVLTPGLRAAFSKQEEVIFDVYANEFGHDRRQFGDLTVFPLPAAPPPVEAPYEVVTIGVSGYPDGLYPVEALSNCVSFPPSMQFQAEPARTAPSPAVVLDAAKVVIVGSRAVLDAATSERLSREFHQVQAYGDFRVLLRGR